MSKILPPILVCLAACIALSAFSVAEPVHYRLASDPSLRGKSKDGQCMDYAIALSSRLAAHRIHGQLIFYRWRIANSDSRGSHVFFMYHLPDNTEWIVDNKIPRPRPVPVDSSPIANGLSLEQHAVRSRGNGAPGKAESAELFLTLN